MLIAHVHRRARRQEHLGGKRILGLRGKVQRGPTRPVHGVRIRPTRQQLAQPGNVTVHRGMVHRSTPHLVPPLVAICHDAHPLVGLDEGHRGTPADRDDDVIAVRARCCQGLPLCGGDDQPRHALMSEIRELPPRGRG